MIRTRSRFVPLLVVTLLVASTLAGVATAAETPPHFRGHATQPTLQPGGTQQVTVELINQAPEPDDHVETAEDVEVWFTAGDAPITVLSGRQYVGDMPDNAPKQVPVSLRVPANVSSGTYDLTMHVRHEYQDGDLRDVETVDVDVRVLDRPRFRVLSADTDVPVGDSGTVSVTLKNVGSEDASDATVALSSTSADMLFNTANAEAGKTATRYVGPWDVGETRTVSYKLNAAKSAEEREYAFQASVSYTDTNGSAGASRSLAVGVTPTGEQSFSVSKLTSTLQVGKEGDLHATVTNEGPETARDAVIRLTSQGQNIHPQETEYALGTLDAGESKSFDYSIEVSDNAAGGPQRFSFVVDYQNTDDDARQSDTLTGDATIAPSRQTFSVEPENGTLTAGGSDTVTLVVTNQGNETLRNINAKAFANDPLSSSDDEAFIASLEPGESADIEISLSASGTALEKTYPLSVDFQYDQPDGDTILSDTYRLPVDVTQSEKKGGPPTLLIVGVVAVLVLVGGAVWWRRRD